MSPRTTLARAATAPGQYGLWMEEALAASPPAEPAPLRGEQQADVCIVGGGYTGLWTAIRVLEAEPSARVVVVEADLCGSGASGRNGGFALSWWAKIATLVERVGSDEAFRLGDAAERAIAELGELCAAEGVEFRNGGWLWTATSRAQAGAWTGAVAACERGERRPFELLSAAAVQERTGSPAHLGGVFERTAATVQPARLVRALRDVAVRRGAVLHEHSPVVKLDRDAGVVHTRAGSVRAESIVLATNAWLARVPELARAVVPLSSDIVATAPMPGRLETSGWTGGEAISDSRMMVHYFRTSGDGRVVFGRGGGGIGLGGRFAFDSSPRRAAEVEADMRRLVPAAAGVPVTHAWGGAVDRSRDGLPFFGTLRARVKLSYGAGFSGNGVAPSLVAGRILASLALGSDDEWSRCGLVGADPGRFPPEPIRFLGGSLVKDAVARKEGREDRGKRVDPVTRRLAALAPSGFFKAGGEHVPSTALPRGDE
jgi:glycine/D-amino acid oxidase-like deaminating enzyme